MEATDRLTARVTLHDVAEEAGVSHALVRQARLDRDHRNHRDPPRGWEAAVARLARKRAEELARLARELEE